MTWDRDPGALCLGALTVARASGNGALSKVIATFECCQGHQCTTIGAPSAAPAPPTHLAKLPVPRVIHPCTISAHCQSPPSPVLHDCPAETRERWHAERRYGMQLRQRFAILLEDLRVTNGMPHPCPR